MHFKAQERMTMFGIFLSWMSCYQIDMGFSVPRSALCVLLLAEGRVLQVPWVPQSQSAQRRSPAPGVFWPQPLQFSPLNSQSQEELCEEKPLFLPSPQLLHFTRRTPGHSAASRHLVFDVIKWALTLTPADVDSLALKRSHPDAN